MYDALRNDGLPLASLIEHLLGRPLVVEVMEDNEAAIVAAQKGYSPRLRHLHRTKRVHVGYLGEVFNENAPQAKLVKAPTAEQKADILNKGMDLKRFQECKSMLQLVPMTCCLQRAPRTLV